MPLPVDVRKRLYPYDPALGRIAIPESYPDDAPKVCFEVNVFWRSALLGVVDRLTWPDAYEGTLEAREVAARKGMLLLGLIAVAGLCGEGKMELRAKPNEPCVLQYSNDEGATWQDAFDFCACLSSCGGVPGNTTGEIQQIINNSAVSIVNLNNTYNGTPESIAPDMDYDGSAGDDDRNATLCNTLYVFVRLQQAALKEVRDQQNSEIHDILQLIDNVGRFIWDMVSEIFDLPPYADILYEIGTIALQIALRLFTDGELQALPEEVFTDELAASEVACCAYLSLKDADITEVQFDDALQACAGFEGQYTEQLRSIMFAVWQERDTYLEFLQLAQELFPATIEGIEIPCDCADWTHTWDFTQNDGGWELVPSYQGAWVTGVGWQVTEDFASTPGMRIQIAVPGGVTEFTSYRCQVRLNCGSQSTVERQSGLRWYEGEIEAHKLITKDCPSGVQTYTIEQGEAFDADLLVVQASVGAQGSGAYARILNATIAGHGVDPFN